MKVENLRIREIFATNSEKTIEVELETKKGMVRSSAPMGTSRGKYEVKYLPVEEVLQKFMNVGKKFAGKEFKDQEEVDSLLRTIDNSNDFHGMGGNLVLAVSSAFLKGFALQEGTDVFDVLPGGKPSIPKPVCNIAGGWKSSKLSDIQEYLLMPIKQKSFLDSISNIAEAYRKAGRMIAEKDKGFNFSRNLESAWATGLNVEAILEIMDKLAAQNELKIGVDFAASQLWDGKKYIYSKSGHKFNTKEQMDFIEILSKGHPIVYFEDPLHEDDFDGFAELKKRLKDKLIVGDDLYATNLERLTTGVMKKSTDGMIIKPNQIGTITDVINIAKYAKKHKQVRIVSHRSGETEDTLICHLAAGLGCEYIKLGISGERTTKINEMIRIEEKLAG